MGEMRCSKLENITERVNLGDLSIDGVIKLKPLQRMVHEN
jgi:hypothetical protein